MSSNIILSKDEAINRINDANLTENKWLIVRYKKFVLMLSQLFLLK